MKTKTKKDLSTIVDNIVDDYNSASTREEKGKVLADLIKGVNVIKEVESQALDDQIKKKRLRLDEEKLELDKERLSLENKKLKMDQQKYTNEVGKFELTIQNENRKLDLDDSKLDFEKQKFNFDLRKLRTDRIFNGIMKGIEVAVPLIVFGGLSVLGLKATYKDDVRVPSETWSFIRSVSKK